MKEDGVGLMAAGGVGVIVGEGIGVLAGSGALVAVGAGEAPCAFWRMKWKSPKAPGSSTNSAVGNFSLTCSRLVVEQVREKFRSEEHTSELQSRVDLVCRLLLEKKKARSAHKY